MALKRFTLIVGLIAFVYLSYLVIMFATKTELPTFAGVIHESIMLPLMIATPIFLVISIVNVVREKFNPRSLSFYAFLLLTAAAVILYLLLRGYFTIESE